MLSLGTTKTRCPACSSVGTTPSVTTHHPYSFATDQECHLLGTLNHTAHISLFCFRLDLQKRHCSDVMQPYSMAEAKSAFARLLRHHQANGWDASSSNQVVPDHSRPARSRPSVHRSSRGGAAVASTSLGTSQQPSAGDKDCAAMHRDHHSNRVSAPSLAPASTAVACPPASYQEKPGDKHRWLNSHTAASPGILPLGPRASSPLLPPAPGQHTATTATDAQADAEAEALCFDNSNERRATSQAAVDLTDSPVKAASSQQQVGTKASAAAMASDQPDAAGVGEETHEATNSLPGPSDVSLEAGVVDLLSPVGPQPAHAKHAGNDLSPDVDTKRRRLSSDACQQVRSVTTFSD